MSSIDFFPGYALPRLRIVLAHLKATAGDGPWSSRWKLLNLYGEVETSKAILDVYKFLDLSAGLMALGRSEPYLTNLVGLVESWLAHHPKELFSTWLFRLESQVIKELISPEDPEVRAHLGKTYKTWLSTNPVEAARETQQSRAYGGPLSRERMLELLEMTRIPLDSLFGALEQLDENKNDVEFLQHVLGQVSVFLGHPYLFQWTRSYPHYYVKEDKTDDKIFDGLRRIRIGGTLEEFESACKVMGISSALELLRLDLETRKPAFVTHEWLRGLSGRDKKEELSVLLSKYFRVPRYLDFLLPFLDEEEVFESLRGVFLEYLGEDPTPEVPVETPPVEISAAQPGPWRVKPEFAEVVHVTDSGLPLRVPTRHYIRGVKVERGKSVLIYHTLAGGWTSDPKKAWPMGSRKEAHSIVRQSKKTRRMRSPLKSRRGVSPSSLKVVCRTLGVDQGPSEYTVERINKEGPNDFLAHDSSFGLLAWQGKVSLLTTKWHAWSLTGLCRRVYPDYDFRVIRIGPAPEGAKKIPQGAG